MLLSKCGLAHAKALEMGILYTRILLAMDGSEEAELASRKAVELANEIESELYVVHVGLLPNFMTGDLGTVGKHSILYEQIERESGELLRKLVWQVKVSGGNVVGAYLRMGAVDLEVVGLAKELGADLIVIGCRGRHGIRRMIGGSVSDAVIRLAPCPVLVVRSPREPRHPSGLSTSLKGDEPSDGD
jgi:nucleotide-binding universal stress UspA family protein